MSISRKRVGSVSQRNDALPPLDIQSIQMPMNPQNALALKTAALSSTKSLFQMATSLRKRLRNVEDFAPFLEQGQCEPLDVVSHMCHVFRLGSPLCHLYNLLIPSFVTPTSPLFAPLPAPAQIEYDFPGFADSPTGVRNWAKQKPNAKPCQRYIALFCMNMKQRREEGRWPGDNWALHELWGSSALDEADGFDSGGLMKVLQTVELMLDHLPESAMSPVSPTTPFTSSSQAFGSIGPMSTMAPAAASSSSGSGSAYDLPFSAGGLASGSNAVAQLAATMNGGVHIEHARRDGAAPAMERTFSTQASADANAYKSVEELVNSERSYVQELEILERCSAEILQAELVSPETVYSMFSNLGKILDFQRKFLIRLETEYEPIEEGRGSKAWAEGRWGRPFVDMEKDFEVYGPYCANYLDAIGIVNEYIVNLMGLPEAERPCLHPERELQAFMIKPIQRITKYGLLLDAILHATAKHNYPHRAELEAGLAAVRRIAADINETTAFKAKQATVRELIERVDDWKGHNHEMFGDLHLDEQFTVSKGDSPREYHVFLFERMMLCCKEVPMAKPPKPSKNTSMLRKDRSSSKAGPPPKPRLALKGRIFVSNISAAILLPPLPGEAHPPARVQIIWTVPTKSGEPDSEDSFVMSGRSEDQMRKWADKVTELSANEKRRQVDERAARIAAGGGGAAHGRYSSTDHGGPGGRYGMQSAFAPPTPAAEHAGFYFPPQRTPSTGMLSQFGEDDDDAGAYGSGLRSGRTTPSLNGSSATYTSAPAGAAAGPSRRVQSQQSMPPLHHAELRARAMTEDQFGPSMLQWRSQQPVPAMPPPPMSRLGSAMSGMSMGAGGTAPDGAAYAPRPIRQASHRALDDDHGGRGAVAASAPNNSGRYPVARGMARAPSHGIPTVPHPAALRSRSASTPNVYQVPGGGMPPVPNTAGAYGWASPPISEHPDVPPAGAGGIALFTKRESAGGGGGGEKRSSGGSQTTETSDTSSQSPATPYTHATAEIRGVMPVPVSRENSGSGTDAAPAAPPLSATSSLASSVRVRLQVGESNLSLQVSPEVGFRELYERVARKLRNCGAAADAGLVKIRWLDSDGDAVAIKSDADVQTMFLEAGHGAIQLIAG